MVWCLGHDSLPFFETVAAKPVLNHHAIGRPGHENLAYLTHSKSAYNLLEVAIVISIALLS